MLKHVTYLNVVQVEFANENENFDARERDLIYNVWDLSFDSFVLVRRSVLQ